MSPSIGTDGEPVVRVDTDVSPSRPIEPTCADAVGRVCPDRRKPNIYFRGVVRCTRSASGLKYAVRISLSAKLGLGRSKIQRTMIGFRRRSRDKDGRPSDLPELEDLLSS